MHYDTHVHTIVSPDSEMQPETAIETLKARGMGVIFTEHVDFYTPEGDYDFVADLDVYPEAYLPYKSASVRLGFEIGLIPEFIEKNRLVSENSAIDYIIGSIHLVDGHDLTGAYFKQPGVDYYRRYLVYAREMVEQNDFFHSLGHIDYISRYSPLPERNVFYSQYADEYDALFHALLERDKVIEINTSRLNDPTARACLFDVYKRYYELGGRFVTIGSDSHGTDRLGYCYDVALRMAGEIGLRPVYFTNRKSVAVD